jgi:hypothetical protein
VKRKLLESEHVQRGDSRECDAHVMSAGFATMCHTHNNTERRGVAHLQLHTLVRSVQTEFTRQTCRLYHDLGVGCGCRAA